MLIKKLDCININVYQSYATEKAVNTRNSCLYHVQLSNGVLNKELPVKQIYKCVTCQLKQNV